MWRSDIAGAEQPGHHDVEDGDEEHGEHGCREHSAKHAGADRMLGFRTCTTGDHQRDDAECECERGHQDWSQAKPRRLDHRLIQTFPLSPQAFCEFHDQDSVLR